jgi:hypothetical protein
MRTRPSCLLTTPLQEPAAKVPITSCRSGTPVVLTTASGSQVPFKLTVRTKEQDEHTSHVVFLHKLTWPEALSDRRLTIQARTRSGAALAASAPHHAVFYYPATIVRHLTAWP